MAFVPVPKDLNRVKTKVMFNLTKRQLICFSVAAVVGLPLFFLVKKSGNVSLAALTMIGVMLRQSASRSSFWQRRISTCLRRQC